MIAESGKIVKPELILALFGENLKFNRQPSQKTSRAEGGLAIEFFVSIQVSGRRRGCLNFGSFC
ncbi:MAG TPA: hypothetical protein VGO59_03085 [Verrucomicrobiae bacterium]|jgi:hypothetical protein